VVAAGWVAWAVHQSDAIAAQTGWDWLQLFGGQQRDQLWVISGLYLLCFPVFWLCGMSFAWGWDAWVDLRKAWVRRRVQRQTAERLSALLERC
jgi:hypothetical protein